MSSNKQGRHWQGGHIDLEHDLAPERMANLASIKLFEGMWSDWGFCESLKRALPAGCIILARDHPLSEQKEEMWRDPIGTGRRHANEWNEKVQRGHYWMPLEITYFLGINEPDATNGDRHAIDLYTTAFLDTLRAHGLRGGAFNFSTGHPRTVDGTGNTPADYAFFEASHQAIVRGKHIAVQHIYGSAEQPCVPGHFDRLKSCPWQDVTWVIGECGIDQHVTTGGEHDGYLNALQPFTQLYPQWLERLIRGTNDPRIHSWQVFTYDFHHPWSSFDQREVIDAFVAWNWKGFDPAPVPNPELPKPIAGALAHPLPAGTYRISQHFWENAEYYRSKYDLPGHNGTDFAADEGTPVYALADGVVAMVDSRSDYGKYVRVFHEALGLHTFYAHLAQQTVVQGVRVTKGQQVGIVGNTGDSSGPHLHLETRIGDAATYSDAAPMPNGRCDPESVCALLGLNLSTGAAAQEAGAPKVWLPFVTATA